MTTETSNNAAHRARVDLLLRLIFVLSMKSARWLQLIASDLAPRVSVASTRYRNGSQLDARCRSHGAQMSCCPRLGTVSSRMSRNAFVLFDQVVETHLSSDYSFSSISKRWWAHEFVRGLLTLNIIKTDEGCNKRVQQPDASTLTEARGGKRKVRGTERIARPSSTVAGWRLRASERRTNVARSKPGPSSSRAGSSSGSWVQPQKKTRP